MAVLKAYNEFTKKYGKACVEVTSYEKINVTTKATEKETLHNVVDIVKIAGNTKEGIIKVVNEEKVFIKNRAKKVQILVKEGKKFEEGRLVEVVKDRFAYTKKEQYKWLEKGNENAGEIHTFIRHGKELSRRGIKNGRNMGDKLLEFGQKEPICRVVNKKGPATIYKDHAGKYYLYAHGGNGFSVTLHPLKDAEAVKKEMDTAIEYCKYIPGKGWGEVIKNIKN